MAQKKSHWNLRHVLANSDSAWRKTLNPTYLCTKKWWSHMFLGCFWCTWSMLRKSCIMSASQTCERCWSPQVGLAMLCHFWDSQIPPKFNPMLGKVPLLLSSYILLSYSFKRTARRVTTYQQRDSRASVQAWQQLLAAPPRYLAPGAWTPSSPRCRTDPCRRKQTASDTRKTSKNPRRTNSNALTKHQETIPNHMGVSENGVYPQL